jgi:hypothetical protein
MLCGPHKIRSKEVAMFNGVRRVDGAKYVVREEDGKEVSLQADESMQKLDQ